MGAEIYISVEVRFNGDSETQYRWEHLTNVSPDRGSAMFTRMAGVTNQAGITPIAEPRGLPRDISRMTTWLQGESVDYHSHSWLSLGEVKELKRWYQSRTRQSFSKWLGTSLHLDMIAPRRPMRRARFDDLRFVFWFEG